MTYPVPPSFPGGENDALIRVSDVSEIIRDHWPHRMSNTAAMAIDNYYLRLYENAYVPRHRKVDHD